MPVGLPIYLIHQFEEHGYDMTGKKYAFVNWWCESMVVLIFLHAGKALTYNRDLASPTAP
jgi:hypothetical protein